MALDGKTGTGAVVSILDQHLFSSLITEKFSNKFRSRSNAIIHDISISN